MIITSLYNNKVLFWNKLKSKKVRDKEKLFLVESENLVNEALKKGIVKEIITLEEKEYEVPTYQVNEAIMKKLTSMVSIPKVMAVCNYIVPSNILGNVLILDRIQDPGNLGTIIRSAVAFGFESIILSNDTVDIYNDKVIRSSEGMLFNINAVKGDLLNIINNLKTKGYLIVGTDVTKGENVKDISKEKVAIVIGNEGAGVSDDIKRLCDKFIYINMNKTCESLNAAVASSIIMYEVYNGK